MLKPDPLSLIMDGLNPQQQDAVRATEGPLLIIAGPGSGKTMTLVHRIIYLVLNGVPAEQIMVATFTEKAAQELVARVSGKLLEFNLKVNVHDMYIGTLHSIFLRILEENREFTRLKRNYRLLDQFEQKYTLFRSLNSYTQVQDSDLVLGGPHTSRWDKVDQLVYYLSKVSEECLEVDRLCSADEPEVRALGELSRIYKRQLEVENAIDFATIESETLRLLAEHTQVLEKLNDDIRYIMVDEYQDTNTIQERVLVMLTGFRHNLCVVGDDDQGLYRFRGATIRNILEFPRLFPGALCKQISLTVNYRSHPGIVDFYNGWMNELDWTDGPMRFRYPKTIVPQDAQFPAITSVIKVSANGEQEDFFREMLDFIQSLEERKIIKDHNQLCFLFRSVRNENVIGLANFLEKNGIRVFSPRSALFFEREEVQLLLGAIIFVFPTLFDDLKWKEDADLQIWKTYAAWKRKFADVLRQDSGTHKPLLQWCQRRAKEHLTLKTNTTYGFTALVYQLLEYQLFARHLKVNMTENKIHLRAAYNLSQVTKLLARFEYIYNISVLTPKYFQKNLRDLFNTYLRYIIEGGIEEFEDFEEVTPSGCVSFMTIHQSKGLEFPVTVVGSLNAVPSKKAQHLDSILETTYYPKSHFEPQDRIKHYDFWRLFYTAFSRPKNLLVLAAREKEGQGRSPSKYFDKIFQRIPSWRDHTVQLDGIQLPTVGYRHLKREYSFTSHILLYENCPLQYKFYKELEFTEIRTGGVLGGSLLHQTIEDIHKSVLRNEVDQLSDSNITTWFNTNYFLLSKSQRSYLRQAQLDSLLRQILRYRDRQSHNWQRIKEAEVDVSLVKEDYILKGTIDLIEGEDGTVELIDFKSGDKPDVNSAEAKTRQTIAQYRRQLEVYAHLVEMRTGQKVSKMHLYYPKVEDGNPYITFGANQGNIYHTISVFDDVVNKIESNNYDMSHITKSEKQCGNCDMRYHCNPRQFTS